MFSKFFLLFIFFVLFPSISFATDVSFEVLEQRAEQGDTSAQFRLGMMYLKVDSVEYNKSVGVSFLQKSAEMGHIYAQHNFGSMYMEGKVFVKDIDNAIKWYLRASRQGYSHSQYILALIYEQQGYLLQSYVWARVLTHDIDVGFREHGYEIIHRVIRNLSDRDIEKSDVLFKEYVD